MEERFPIKGNVGQCFQRDLKKDPSLKDTYNGLVGHKAKSEFRAKWASMKMESAMSLKEKLETTRHKEKVEGTYMSFKRIWDQEGADADGFQAETGTCKSKKPKVQQVDITLQTCSKTDMYMLCL